MDLTLDCQNCCLPAFWFSCSAASYPTRCRCPELWVCWRRPRRHHWPLSLRRAEPTRVARSRQRRRGVFEALRPVGSLSTSMVRTRPPARKQESFLPEAARARCRRSRCVFGSIGCQARRNAVPTSRPPRRQRKARQNLGPTLPTCRTLATSFSGSMASWSSPKESLATECRADDNIKQHRAQEKSMLCPTGRSVQRCNGIVRSTAEWPFGRQSEGVTLMLGPHAGPWLDIVLRS